jgi:hypothetical protein
MIGASIYGFVDYNKTRNKKEFTNLYKEKEAVVPVTEVAPEKTDLVIEEKRPLVKKENEVTNKVTTTSVKKEANKTIKQKERKFRPELFSRGALDEKYIEKEIKMEDPKTKTESGKIENKEQ